MKKIVKAALCFVMALCMVNIAPVVDASSPSSVIVAEAASKIKINKTKIYITKGTKYTLKVTGTKKKVKWTVGNKKTATVSAKGVVTAKNKGKTIVTAKVAGKKLKCTVYVETPSISAKTAAITIHNRKTIKLNGTKRTPAWKSSNTKVATVSKGVISAKGVGTATITATLNKKNYTCKVTVKKAAAAAVGNSVDDVTDGIISYMRGEITESEFRSKYVYPYDLQALSDAYYAGGGKENAIADMFKTKWHGSFGPANRFCELIEEVNKYAPEYQAELKKTYVYTAKHSLSAEDNKMLIANLSAFNNDVLKITDSNMAVKDILIRKVSPDLTGTKYYASLFNKHSMAYVTTPSGVYFIGIIG